MYSGAFFNGSSTSVAQGDFDQSLNPITSYEQGSAGGAYSVREGDTLAGLAERLWGDASLWWKIAEANGLTGQAALVEGQALTLPAGVMRATHNAQTFQPYDPSEALGDTAPTTLQPTPKKNKCGVLGRVFLQIIALAVSTAIDFIFPGVGRVVNAALTSIITQGVGVATGIQEKFSWNQVALSAISAGVNARVSGIDNAFLRGATASARTQGVAVATGLQDKFSWSAVAAAGVGASVGAFASAHLSGAAIHKGGELVKPATWGNRIGAGLASGMSMAATRSLIDGTDFGDNLIAVLPDLIGQTIGGAFAKSVSYSASAQKTTADVYGSILTGRYASALKTQAPLNAITGAYQTADIFSDVGNYFSDLWGSTLGRFFDDNRTQSPAGAGNLTFEDEIVVTGVRKNPFYGGYQPIWERTNIPLYAQRARGAVTYANAAPTRSYLDDVGAALAGGWRRFEQGFAPPRSIGDVFQHSLDPFGARHIGNALGILSSGIGEMARPLFPDSDGEWAWGANNAAHPFVLDPQHFITGQERRDMFGNLVVGLATARMPIGGARAVVTQEINAARIVDDVPYGAAELREGSFSIADWWRYPDGYARPPGPFRLLQGEERGAARLAANRANRALHEADPTLSGLEIHEIHPVKFGGSPTNLANKIFLTPEQHSPLTTWWRQLQRDIEGR